MKIEKKKVLEIIEAFYKEHNGFGNYSRATLIKRINALPASDNEWVSVSERLPEDEKVVLVWLPLDDMPDIGGRKLAYIADGRWYGGIKQILGITHWCNLPSPPTK